MWQAPPPMLRPLGVGERIDATFKIWTRNFLNISKAMLVIAVPAAVVEALVNLSTTSTSTTSPFGLQTTATVGTDLATRLGGISVNALISFVVASLATATLFRIIGNAYLGQPSGWRDALRFGASKLLSIIWISIAIGAGEVVPMAVGFVAVTVAVVALVSLHVTAVTVLAIIAGVLLGIGVLAYGVWFWVCTSLARPTLMLEDVRGIAAIRRSFRLVKRSWWSIFGTEILVFLITEVAGSVVGGILAVIEVAAKNSPVATSIVTFFSVTTSLVLFTPLTAIVLVVITIDMRVRKEGYDIQHLATTIGTSPGTVGPSFARPATNFYGPPPGYPGQPYGGAFAPPPATYGYPPLPPAGGYGAPSQQPPPAGAPGAPPAWAPPPPPTAGGYQHPPGVPGPPPPPPPGSFQSPPAAPPGTPGPHAYPGWGPAATVPTAPDIPPFPLAPLDPVPPLPPPPAPPADDRPAPPGWGQPPPVPPPVP